MANLANILLILDQLSEEELNKLETLLVNRKRTDDCLELDLYSRLNSYLNGALAPFYVFKRRAYYDQWQQSVCQVRKVFESMGVPKSGINYLKMVNITLFSIVSYQDKLSIPLGVKTVSQSLRKIDQILDDQFPGYLHSGLFYSLVKGTSKWH